MTEKGVVIFMKYLAVILGIFGLELRLKNYIEETKKEDTEEYRCKNALIIRKHHNSGAFLNAGESRQKTVMALSVFLAAALTIFYLLTLGRAGKGLLKWGLTLLLGGAYSNTYDRIKRNYVVDYVSFNVPWKWLRRIVFNIGDFCILIGAMMCVFGYGDNEA